MADQNNIVWSVVKEGALGDHGSLVQCPKEDQ